MLRDVVGVLIFSIILVALVVLFVGGLLHYVFPHSVNTAGNFADRTLDDFIGGIKKLGWLLRKFAQLFRRRKY
jgi:hypothetical protein